MFDGLSATLGVTSVGTRKGDDANSFELPDYMGTDIGLHYRPLKHAAVGFFIESLFDIVGSRAHAKDVLQESYIQVDALLSY